LLPFHVEEEPPDVFRQRSPAWLACSDHFEPGGLEVFGESLPLSRFSAAFDPFEGDEDTSTTWPLRVHDGSISTLKNAAAS
jgi:hypothetical protein